MKTVKDIVTEYLKSNGYDGLYNDDCGCPVDDLAPCCQLYDDCTAGYRHDTCECGCDDHIGPKESEES